MSIKDFFESEMFFYLIFTGIALVAILYLILVMRVKRHNAKQPILSAQGKILTKTKVWTIYSVLVELETGERKQLEADLALAAILMENDTGKITYQGSKIISFERECQN